jgi:DNA-binding transcriptional ArsR family regulator
MSQVFPLRSSVSLDDRQPRLVDLDDDVADEVFEALSARTTRRVFSALHDEPRAASDLATVTDTSIQNAQYHLEKLQDADLVGVVDTWYSERGTEMDVYAPLVSLAAARLGAWPTAGEAAPTAASADAAAVAADESGDGGGSAAGDTAVERAADGAGEVAAAASGVDPALLAGVACFVGGLVVLAVVGAVWYRRGGVEQSA